MAIAVELVVCEFLFVAAACGFLVYHYQGSLVTWDVSLSVYLAWVLGFSAVLLLPYDLSLAVVQDLQSSILIKMWSFVYWSTFMLAWLVLPIQMEFHASGHFTVKEKLMDSMKKLLFGIVAAVVLGVAYMVYMVASSGLTFDEVISFMMAMSNTYGVLLITVLMGSGLVSLPKRLWNMADSDAELRRLYLSASTVEEAYQESRYELEDCELEIRKAVELLEKSGPGSSLAKEVGPYILILKNKSANFMFAGRATTNVYIKGSSNKEADYSDKKVLVNLHARLMKCQLKARASERRWRVLIQTCKQHQDSQNPNLSESDAELGWCLMPVAGSTVPASSGVARGFHMCLVAAYKFWINYCFHTFCRVAAIALGVGSCLILWSEMVMASNLQSPLGWLMGAYLLNDAQPVIVQGVAFLALAYMSICTYWTLFRMNIGWSYRLQAPQLSSPSSLIFNAEYLSRLQFSLGYNFLLCINVVRTNDTAFRTLMQNIEIIPVFGTSFTVYVPIIMVIIAVITFFDGFSRLLSFLGIDSEEAVYGTGACKCWSRGGASDQDMDASLLEKYNGGKAVIASELRTLALQQETLAKARAAYGGGTVLGTSNGSSVHSVTTEPTRNPLFGGDKGANIYTKVDLSAPVKGVDDDDDDELGLSVYSTTRGATGKWKTAEDDLGPSIYSATSGAGKASWLSAASSAPTTARQAKPALAAPGPTSAPRAKVPAPKAAAPASKPPAKNFAASEFNFDDDEDDPPAHRGRYADF